MENKKPSGKKKYESPKMIFQVPIETRTGSKIPSSYANPAF